MAIIREDICSWLVLPKTGLAACQAHFRELDALTCASCQ